MSEETRKLSILAVDDVPENLDTIRGILSPEYTLRAAINGEIALKIATTQSVDLILLDIMMPGMNGYEVCQQLKANIATRNIPVIFLTAKDLETDEKKGLDLGALDYIMKPVSAPILKARVQTHLALYQHNQELEEKVKARTKQIDESRLEAIRILGRAAEYRDNETGLHVIRMSHFARILAEALGLPDTEINLIHHAAPMHDVGKIGIADKILLKPGKLNQDEWEIMREHPNYGAQIIGHRNNSESELMEMASVIALTHHEKWDGSGYPNGLKGKDIPLAGRIVAVADVFDALTSARCYKQPWSVEKTISLLKEESGKHFDPLIIEKFSQVIPQILEIKEQYRET